MVAGRMQRIGQSPSAPRPPLTRCPLGGRLSRANAAALTVIGLMSNLAVMQANQPTLPISLSPDAELLLIHMAAGTVPQKTVESVIQALLDHDFGNFDAANYMGSAVKEGMVHEGLVRDILKSHGCSASTRSRSLACRFTLEAFEASLGYGGPDTVQVPACIGDGMNLFEGDTFVQMRSAVLWGSGDFRVIALVRSIPAQTLQRVKLGPPGVVVTYDLWSTNSDLFCTIEAWRTSDWTPNRWQAVLMTRLCLARRPASVFRTLDGDPILNEPLPRLPVTRSLAAFL